MHTYTVWSSGVKISPNSVGGFRRVALTICYRSIFNFGRISTSITPQKTESKFSVNSYVLHNYKILRNSLSSADKINIKKAYDWQTDWRTDRRVKNIIVAWNIIKLNIKLHLSHDFFDVSHVIGYVRCAPRSSRDRSTCTSIGQHWCSAYISMKSMRFVICCPSWQICLSQNQHQILKSGNGISEPLQTLLQFSPEHVYIHLSGNVINIATTPTLLLLPT